MFIEETALSHRLVPIRVSKGEQFAPEFLAISPNGKIPALVDHSPTDGGGVVSMFESGAMLIYLADKVGKLVPTAPRQRHVVLQWLFWQASGLGAMAGQAGHFRVYAPETVPYAVDRYTKETARLFGVLDTRLSDHEYIADKYSIADIACYPWIVPHVGLGQNLAEFPHLGRWYEGISARPATRRTYEGVEDVYAGVGKELPDEERQVLFGRSSK